MIDRKYKYRLDKYKDVQPWTITHCLRGLPGESKKFQRLAGFGIRSMQAVIKTEMVILHLKANLDEKFCLVK